MAVAPEPVEPLEPGEYAREHEHPGTEGDFKNHGTGEVAEDPYDVKKRRHLSDFCSPGPCLRMAEPHQSYRLQHHNPQTLERTCGPPAGWPATSHDGKKSAVPTVLLLGKARWKALPNEAVGLENDARVRNCFLGLFKQHADKPPAQALPQ